MEKPPVDYTNPIPGVTLAGLLIIGLLSGVFGLICFGNEALIASVLYFSVATLSFGIAAVVSHWRK
ncbi:MAG: hypothetical protein LAT58_12405 [Opitutales bacterium]|nr:hypothetical protein [Opitutales bacterium]